MVDLSRYEADKNCAELVAEIKKLRSAGYCRLPVPDRSGLRSDPLDVGAAGIHFIVVVAACSHDRVVAVDKNGVAEMLTSFTVGGKDLGNIGNAAVASSVSAPVTAFCRSLAP